MALTIEQANDVNTVLRWALGIPLELGVLKVDVTDDKAHDAAMRLVGHARKALSAGLGTADVEAAWPAQSEGPAAQRRVFDEVRALASEWAISGRDGADELDEILDGGDD